MPSPSVNPRFGRIVCDDEIQAEVIAKLEAWILTYQAEIERQRGWNPRDLAEPASIIPITLLDRQPADAFPCIAVRISTGDAQRGDRGDQSMTWQCEVFVMAEGTDDEDTNMRVGAHVAAVRAILLRHVRTGPLITNVGRPSTEYSPTIEMAGRTRGMGAITVSLGVNAALNDSPNGLTTPPDDPYATPAGLSEVLDVNVTVGRYEP